MTSVACCAGNLHEGTPRGHEETLHGLPSYVTEPPNNESIKGIVVIIPDAYGWTFKNIRILADTYAERIGARCLLPDFMDGKQADQSGMTHVNNMTNASASYISRFLAALQTVYLLLPWAYQNRISVAWPRILAFFTALRSSTSLPIGAAGFCWGGRHVVALAHGTDKVKGKPLIDVGYTAHPFNLTIPADIEAVKLPLAIDQGTEDFLLNMAGVKTIEEIFERKNGESGNGEQGKRFVIRTVEGAKHGFAVRCDMENPEEAKQEQIAEDHAVEWFGRWFAKAGDAE